MVKARLAEGSALIIILKFILGPILFFSGFGILFIILDFQSFLIISGFMIAYFFPPLGKETILPMGIGAGFHPILISLSIAYIDIVIGLFLLWNYDFVKLVPFLGRWMERFEKRGREISKGRTWIKGLEFIGIIFFVIFPFQGSGGVGATILGRLLGLNRYIVFIAIVIGSITGCLFIAYSAETIKNIILSNYQLGLIIVISIIIIVMYYLYRRKVKNSLKRQI